MKKSPLEIFDTWIMLVNERDVNGIPALYDPKAVLIPTFSENILNTPEKIRNYFEKLALRKGLQISIHQKTLNEQEVVNEMSILSGIYCWKLLVDEELITFEARFSFLIDISKNAPIIHHHSSQIPRMI